MGLLRRLMGCGVGLVAASRTPAVARAGSSGVFQALQWRDKNPSRPFRKNDVVQVVSDVDDTIKSSGNKRFVGIALGGIDAQYGRNVFYPGVCQFAIEIARRGDRSVKDIPSMAVLTARARELKFAIGINDSSAIAVNYRRAGLANGLRSWGVGKVLYGSVREWVFQSLKAQRKFDNFGILEAELPADVPYVFVGDTGEYDEVASERIARKYGPKVLAIFLHVVSETGYVNELQPDRQVAHDEGGSSTPVCYFKTYVGAATKAANLGLMSTAGVERVIQAAMDSLRGEPRKGSKWADLEEDVRIARRALGPGGELQWSQVRRMLRQQRRVVGSH